METFAILRSADYCDCCDFSAIEALQNASMSASFNVCTGLREAPQACTCSGKGLEVRCHCIIFTSTDHDNVHSIALLSLVTLLHRFPKCFRRFSVTTQPPSLCFLDVDEDGIVDIHVSMKQFSVVWRVSAVHTIVSCTLESLFSLIHLQIYGHPALPTVLYRILVLAAVFQALI